MAGDTKTHVKPAKQREAEPPKSLNLQADVKFMCADQKNDSRFFSNA